MRRVRFPSLLALGLGASLLVGGSSLAFAQDGHDHGPGQGHGGPPGDTPAQGVAPRRPVPIPAARRPPPPGSSARAARPADAHGDGHGHGDAHGAAPAGGHGEAHHTPPMNWMYGLIGEKEGAEPGLIWRPKGMPAPFLAMLINFGLLVGLGFRFARKPIVDGVKDRKKNIMRDIDEATKTKAAAKKRYTEYKKKLESIDEEVSRIRTEYAEQAARDQTRILADAEASRARMLKDAEFVLAQERKQLQQELLLDTVARATQGAEDLLRQRLGASDQDRLAEEFLGKLATTLGPSSSVSKGAS